MTSQSIVRLADPKDEDAIFELCRMLHAENGLFPMDDSLVRETMMKGIEKKGGILGVIGPVGGPLEGIIYMIISSFWYSRKPSLSSPGSAVVGMLGPGP